MYEDVVCFRGQIRWVTDTGKTTGSEQAGTRPAVIVSNDTGNEHSPTVEVVYLTSRKKSSLPTHVQLMCEQMSTVMCESVYTVSKMRLGGVIRECTDEEMEQIDRALMISLSLPVNDRVTETKSARAMEIELGIYKALYEMLLDKVMKGIA